MTTVAGAVAETTQRLRAAGIDSPQRDARALVARALGLPPQRILLHGPELINASAASVLRCSVKRRLAREPVSKIIGCRQFWGREFHISDAVLDPRPETETLVGEALRQPACRILDLGTGSGILAITLLSEWPSATALATDISAVALEVAAQNARRFGVQSRLSLQAGDWFDVVQGRFDLIVSNPPYISAMEFAALAPEVRDYDPHLALTPGGDGLAAYRVIVATASKHLTPSGRLLVEIGYLQAEPVRQLFIKGGFLSVETHLDLEGRNRVIAGRLGPSAA